MQYKYSVLTVQSTSFLVVVWRNERSFLTSSNREEKRREEKRDESQTSVLSSSSFHTSINRTLLVLEALPKLFPLRERPLVCSECSSWFVERWWERKRKEKESSADKSNQIKTKQIQLAAANSYLSTQSFRDRMNQRLRSRISIGLRLRNIGSSATKLCIL